MWCVVGRNVWGKEPHSTASHQNLLTGSISSNATPANSIVPSASIAVFVSKWSRRWCKEKEMWPASWGIRDILFITGTQFPDDPCQILLSWTRREVKVRSTLSCHPKIMWTQDATKIHLRPQFKQRQSPSSKEFCCCAEMYMHDVGVFRYLLLQWRLLISLGA